MKFFGRKITVPATNDKVEVDTLRTWSVRWCSYDRKHYGGSSYSDYAHSTAECVFFTDENVANGFATALRDAVALLRNKNMQNIVVKEEK